MLVIDVDYYFLKFSKLQKGISDEHDNKHEKAHLSL